MNNKKSLNIIAKFFNTYEIIDFDDSKKYEEQKKILEKQLENLGTEVKPAVLDAGKEYTNKGEIDIMGSLFDDLVNGLVTPEKFDKVINNLKKFKSVCNGNGIEIYPSPALMEIIELLTFE